MYCTVSQWRDFIEFCTPYLDSIAGLCSLAYAVALLTTSIAVYKLSK